MRLLLVSHSPNNPDGGASRVYHFLSDGFRQRGHEVVCLHLDDVELPCAFQRAAIRCMLPIYMSRAAAQVMRQNSAPFDIVFSSNGMLAPLSRRLLQKPDRPLLVSHYHGLNFFDIQATLAEAKKGNIRVSPLFRWVTGPIPMRWDRRGAHFADLSIVQNRRDEQALLEQGVRNVKRIPLGVHPEIIAAGENAPRQTERNPKTLFWFGSWTDRKGIYYLPEAFARICERFPETQLTIGGTGKSPEEITGQFQAQLRSRITVLPRISIGEQILRMADHAIFLFPSLSEGFGFAALEALAMGMAVIATPTGLGADWLTDRQNARLIPASSSRHLSDAANELIEDSKLREHLAENGRQLAQTLTVGQMIDTYEQVLTMFLDQHRHRITTANKGRNPRRGIEGTA